MQVAPQLSFDDTSIAFSSKSDKDLRQTYWMFRSMNNPALVKVGTNLVNTAFTLRLPVKGLIKQTLFKQFCGGETIEDSRRTIAELQQGDVGTILDYSVEGEKSEEGFEATYQELLRTVAFARGNPAIPFCVFKVTGVGKFEILEKVQAKASLNEEESAAFRRIENRVDTICRTAYENDVRIFIDAEESWIQGAIDTLAYQMMRKYNQEKAIVYNTFQMYRHDMLSNLRRAFHYAATHSYWLGVKLVRGAYLERERSRAATLGYTDPMQATKQATDDDFNSALRFCIDNKQRVAICCGSHNEYSNHYLVQLMEKYNVSPGDPNFYFAQLYGMSDNISFNLADAGYNVAKYVPYGPVEAVLPYLFRRAAENTSIAGQTSRELMLVQAEIHRRRGG